MFNTDLASQIDEKHMIKPLRINLCDLNSSSSITNVKSASSGAAKSSNSFEMGDSGLEDLMETFISRK